MLLRRIAYVLKIFPKISETFIVSELAELRRRGVELRILSLQPPRAGLRHDCVAGAGLERITCYELEEFSNIIKEFRPQLLHAHFATEATETAIELATEHGIPFTFTAHGYDVHRKAPPDFGRRAAAARTVVTVSQANADFIARTFAVRPSHLRVIPCGVDTQLFHPGNGRAQSHELPGGVRRATVRAATEPALIVCVARQVEVKNLELLLQCCARLRTKGVKFRCALVGDGPCRGELAALRARLGLDDLVEMPGAAEQKEVLGWWQRATVAALSSNSEGMPVSLMEAAACGVPAVATAVGGVPELIEDGVTGWLVPAGDTSAMAEALETLIVDHDLRARMSLAARQRAEEKFSVERQVENLLGLWSEILAAGGPPPVFVSDRFEAKSDSSMPTLALALEPGEARKELKHHLPRVSGEAGKLRLKAIRVIRHKPGKRCVVEYDLRVERPGQIATPVTLLGKTRAKRFGKEGYRVLDRLWKAGFDSASPDGVSVPEPIGVIPRFQMWFQRKVPGKTANELLGGPDGVELARRIAEAIHKLHQARIPTERRHSMSDELRILRECLGKVAEFRPEWGMRLERVLAACDRLGASVPEPQPCGIHRDFYPAQVIIETGDLSAEFGRRPRPRIYLIDFDLYCLGDPGLDIGNFIGHISEQSLRESGDAGRWAEQELALKEKFIDLSGGACRIAVEAYTTLTLVRHIYLSTQFPQRQEFATAVLDLCEQRLDLRPRGK